MQESNVDPRGTCKPLLGPLQGHYRLVYSRYRAVYAVEEEAKPGGDVHLHIRVQIVVVGIRKDRDKKDVYKVAKKLVDLGLLPSRGPGREEGPD